MKRLNYWNHNVAYYNWINKKIGNRKKILDVGCGDGELAKYLINPYREITGIDTSRSCIEKANKDIGSDLNLRYYCTSFEDYNSQNEFYDAILFVASIHHMDMENAINKAKNLLKINGILIVVGLYKPSTLFDWILEVLRILPCAISSLLYGYKSSEDMGVPTSYNFLDLSTIRNLIRKNLPGSKLKPGLYYRYKLAWIKD